MTILAAPVQQASRLANRAKREAMFRVPPVRRLAEGRHQRLVRRHADSLPTLQAADRAIIDQVRGEGVYRTSMDELALPGSAAVQQRLGELVEKLAATPTTSSAIRTPHEDLLADLSVWHFGLNDRLLDIVENYLGVPARYYGADIRREVADGIPDDVRQWHRDIEDHRMLKVLVWLNDVDADGGPFAYLPRALSAQTMDRLHYVGGFISDDKLRAVVPDAEWQLATGPKWTTVIPDTSQVLHRATPPTARDRYSVTFSYTSRRPINTRPAKPFTADEIRRIRTGLSERQLACLPRTAS